jgi:hypothetical protein
MDLRFDAAAKAAYKASLSIARMKYTAIGDEMAAVAAQRQFNSPEIGGVRLSRNPYDHVNGIYALIGVKDGWPYFQDVRGGTYLFHRPYDLATQGPEWVFSMYYEPTADSSSGRIPCDGGCLPLGVQHWMGSRKARAPQTVILLEVSLVSPGEVTAARESVLAERDAAQAALMVQLEGKTAVVIKGSSNAKLNGRFTIAEDYDGWPHFMSETGMHLFRHLPANAWRVSPSLGPKPVGDATIQAITLEGNIPEGTLHSPGKGTLCSWSILRFPHWYHEQGVSISLESAPTPARAPAPAPSPVPHLSKKELKAKQKEEDKRRKEKEQAAKKAAKKAAYKR